MDYQKEEEKNNVKDNTGKLKCIIIAGHKYQKKKKVMHYICPSQIIPKRLLQDYVRTDASDTSEKQWKLHNDYWATNIIYMQKKLHAEKLLVPKCSLIRVIVIAIFSKWYSFLPSLISHRL